MNNSIIKNILWNRRYDQNTTVSVHVSQLTIIRQWNTVHVHVSTMWQSLKPKLPVSTHVSIQLSLNTFYQMPNYNH